jgi:hypothetical protein
MSNVEIVRNVGENISLVGGKDYMAPRIRIVPNTHETAQDNEKAIHISQGKEGVSLSLETLETILRWARGQQ